MKIFNMQILEAFQKKFSKGAKTVPGKIEIDSTCVFYWPNGRVTEKDIALIECTVTKTRIVFNLCYKEKELRLVVLNPTLSLI